VWLRDGGPPVKGPIIGVAKDFHFQSLHEPLRPLMMRLENRYNFAVIKLQSANFESTIKNIEGTWRKFDNRFRFEFSFLDEQLNQLYHEEQNMVSVLDIFSFLGVGIACMGLLGIAALAFRQRTKEVSIRKVLGASLSNLILLLVKDFTRLVLIAVMLAVPLVWWLMNSWLQNFSFRITINPIVFVITGVTLVLVCWITLGFLTMKTARINPAETLKSE
jgi:putative ABC transport system permease protein